MEAVKEKTSATAYWQRYASIRQQTELICSPLRTEDYVAQPIVDVSPPKWHLGHTTWFFETFILIPHATNYHAFHPDYNYVFNSYYETVGARVLRTDRGNLSRPTTEEIYAYRKHVNAAMEALLLGDIDFPSSFWETLELGMQHEQQHQELLVTDIKYILGNNPLFPPYSDAIEHLQPVINTTDEWVNIPEGIYEIGHQGNGFCFDNELGVHNVFLHAYSVMNRYITNAEYMAFMEDGGYADFNHWLAEGWDWVKGNNVQAPMYWFNVDGGWQHYELNGLQPVDGNAPVKHISFFEADAFASWKGQRLLTEFEWEVASTQLKHGDLWEWTNSAYLPYPGFSKAPGAIGEYNGKFMINQMVLRGGSVASPSHHVRPTYRNFFHPHLRWQFTGIRLAEKN